MIYIISKKVTNDNPVLDSKICSKLEEEGKALFFPGEEELSKAYNEGKIPSNDDYIMFFEPNPEEDYCEKLSKKIINYVKLISPDILSVDVGNLLEKNDDLLSYWRIDIDNHDGYPMECYITKVAIDNKGEILVDAMDLETGETYEEQPLYTANDFESTLGALEDIYNSLDELAR